MLCLERAGVGVIQRLIPLRISLSAPIFPHPPYTAFTARIRGRINTCLATPTRQNFLYFSRIYRRNSGRAPFALMPARYR